MDGNLRTISHYEKFEHVPNNEGHCAIVALIKAHLLRNLVQICQIDAPHEIHIYFVDIFWVVLHLLEVEPAAIAERNLSFGRLLAQFHINEQLLVDVEFLHNVDTLADDAFRVRVVVYEPFADHFGGNVSNALNSLHMLDATHEPVLFKVAFGATVAIYLCFHHKLALLSKIASKLTCNDESLLGAESDLAKRNGNAILVQHLSSLILVQHHVSLGDTRSADNCAFRASRGEVFAQKLLGLLQKVI